MKIGMAADHGGFYLKEMLADALREDGHEITDFGASEPVEGDDYPDYVIPLARAVAGGEVERGVAICGSGVGASIAANKVHSARAALITDPFSARQGAEDDNMNIICLGGRVVAFELALDLVRTFLSARFKGEDRHRRRLEKVNAAEAATGVRENTT